MPQKTIRQYFRDKRGNPEGVAIAIWDEGDHDSLSIGTSFCHSKKDRYNKVLGIKIAQYRAELRRHELEGKGHSAPQRHRLASKKFSIRAGLAAGIVPKDSALATRVLSLTE